MHAHSLHVTIIAHSKRPGSRVSYLFSLTALRKMVPMGLQVDGTENKNSLNLKSPFFSESMEKDKENVICSFRLIKKTGEDDPKRMVHAVKVGQALTIVSLFYYVNPLYEGFGVNAMWVVLTVVVVMEYTVGKLTTERTVTGTAQPY